MSTPESKPATKAFPTLASPSLLRWVMGLAILAFGVAVLYGLSIGPAILMNKRGVITPETLERVYFPLSLVASGIPGSGPLVDWYVRLWVDPGPPPAPPR
ncbi:MAG: hypothetical protein AB9869_33235 [Verrucomicrobiia bacterium]